MELRKDFLWGGATAANQYEGGYLEGGKGLSIADVERGARHGVKRQIDPEILPGVFYPSHEATHSPTRPPTSVLPASQNPHKHIMSSYSIH